MNSQPPGRPLLTTLGTAVIDELRFKDGTISRDILGGSGVHCALGARLFLPSPSSSSVCGHFHVGHDFPTSAEHLLLSWKSDLEVKWSVDKPTASNIVTFEDATMGPQTRNYVHRSVFTHPTDVSTRALTAGAFHLTCPPEELEDQVSAIGALRPSSLPRPLIVWEPWPKACTSQNKSTLAEALRHVNVFSPNRLELMSFFDFSPESFDRKLIESLATNCIELSIGSHKQGNVIVRCGGHGSLLANWKLISSSHDSFCLEMIWLPPFHTDPQKVVCTTGAGNAFLGGLVIGWLETSDWFKACCYGSVAASFLVEQVGLPTRTGLGEFEFWNGDTVRARLGTAVERMQAKTKALAAETE